MEMPSQSRCAQNDPPTSPLSVRSSPLGSWRASSAPVIDSLLTHRWPPASVAPLETPSAGLVRHRPTEAAIVSSTPFSIHIVLSHEHCLACAQGAHQAFMPPLEGLTHRHKKCMKESTFIFIRDHFTSRYAETVRLLAEGAGNRRRHRRRSFLRERSEIAVWPCEDVGAQEF
jgi:hypothetical protein